MALARKAAATHMAAGEALGEVPGEAPVEAPAEAAREAAGGNVADKMARLRRRRRLLGKSSHGWGWIPTT